LHLKYKKHISSNDGVAGSSAQKTGAEGVDTYVYVPLGTIAKNAETGEVLFEITEHDQQKIIAQGGRGGLGNVHFKSATQQTPRFAQPGEPGIEGWFILELKVLADVGLVGFPNAGKSTLMNTLTDAGVYVENKLFATLDTTVRSFDLPNGKKALLSDTIGFIRKLPTHLIASFRSTLSEVREADILMHVIDLTHPFFREHIKVVNETIKSLKIENKPIISIFNKVDSFPDYYELSVIEKEFPNCFFISALRGINIVNLLEGIQRIYDENSNVSRLLMPYDQMRLISQLYSMSEIINKEEKDEGIYFELRVNEEMEAQFKNLYSEYMITKN